MSSSRSRSGGSAIDDAFSRRYRSSRSAPSVTASLTGVRVAAIRRKSVMIRLLPPTRMKVCESSARKQRFLLRVGQRVDLFEKERSAARLFEAGPARGSPRPRTRRVRGRTAGFPSSAWPGSFAAAAQSNATNGPLRRRLSS